jgi:formylglycine-generating enzyme required for sulfatase activity
MRSGDMPLHDIKKPGTDFLETESGVLIKMIWIDEGKFIMGSRDHEKKGYYNQGSVEVQLDGFWISRTPVTQAQYKSIMGENPSKFEGDNNPVENVSWNNAMEFCRKLSDKTGYLYSLPTEARWEYSCRAGSKTRFSYGDNPDLLGNYAWYDINSGGKTHPVGMKKPNDWGLFDMHGNVWEWCIDWYGKYPDTPQKNPEGPKKGCRKILRGGSWYYSKHLCRSSYRYYNPPIYKFSNIGFRICI